jgi:hypothetical protein
MKLSREWRRKVEARSNTITIIRPREQFCTQQGKTNNNFTLRIFLVFLFSLLQKRSTRGENFRSLSVFHFLVSSRVINLNSPAPEWSVPFEALLSMAVFRFKNSKEKLYQVEAQHDVCLRPSP